MTAVVLCKAAPWVGTSRDLTTIDGIARQTDADAKCEMRREMGLPELLVGSQASKTPIEKTAAFKLMKKRAIDICLICSDGGFEREQRPRRPPSSHFGNRGTQLCTSG